MFEEVDLGGTRPRHVVLGVIAALAVGAALISGIGKAAGFTRLTDTVRDADFQWLAVCALGESAVFAGYAGALRATVAWDGGPRLATLASLQIVLASFAATQLIAVAGVAGLAVVFWAMRRLGHDRHVATVRVIGLSTLVYFVLGVLAWAFAWWAALDQQVSPGITIPWLVSFPLLIAAARWFTSTRRVRRWTDPETGGAFRRALATGIEAAAWVRTVVASPDGLPLLAWAAVYWAGDVLSLWAALHAFGARPALAALAMAYATGYLVQSLPVPFIATGGVDAATAFLLQSMGVPLEIALAAVVTHRVFAFWLPVVPGAIFATTLPRLGRRLKSQEAPHPER